MARSAFWSLRLLVPAVCVVLVAMLFAPAHALVKESVTTRSVHFALNSDRIRPDAARTLDAIRAQLKEHPATTLELVGHTCDLASSAYNDRLARRRAESVRRYLLRGHATLADRVLLESRGKDEPRVENATDSARELNRRVEIRIVTREEIPEPEVTLSLEPKTILRGETAILTWTSRHAVGVAIAPDLGDIETTGFRAIVPARSAVYVATATGEGGRAVAEAAVAVRIPPPTLIVEVTPTTVTRGQPVTVTWRSTDATRVDIAGVGENLAPSGSASVQPPGPVTFAGVASGEGGQKAQAAATVVVSVPPPTVSLAAMPADIPRGQSSTLTWSSTDATFVEIAPGVGRVAASGSATVQPALTTTYVATAVGEGGRDLAATSVSVLVPSPAVTLLASPSSIEPGTAASLTWTSANADIVEIAPGIGRVPAEGTMEIRPALTTSYVATAMGAGGRDAAAATVTVLAPPPPAPEPAPISTPIPPPLVQAVRVSVVDAEGQFLTGLPSNVFGVKVDGVDRQVLRVVYEADARTAGVVLVLDRSASMVDAMPALRDAATRFVEQKKDEDRILIMSFSSDIDVLGDFNAERLALTSAIRGITARGQTRLYDALFTAAERAATTAEPRYVVLMTDGVDEGGLFGTGGSQHSLEDAVRKAQAAGAAVFTIGLGSTYDADVLRRIANETGGAAYFTPDQSRLNEIYSRLSTGLLRGSYRVEYLTTDLDASRATVTCSAGRVLP